MFSTKTGGVVLLDDHGLVTSRDCGSGIAAA